MPIHPFRSFGPAAHPGPRWLIAIAIVVAACARPATIPTVVLPFPADSSVARLVAPGVVQRSIWSSKGPWAIQVIDVDLSRCYSAIAVKGAPGAMGRKKVSVLLDELRATNEVIGGVNAD